VNKKIERGTKITFSYRISSKYVLFEFCLMASGDLIVAFLQTVSCTL